MEENGTQPCWYALKVFYNKVFDKLLKSIREGD